MAKHKKGTPNKRNSNPITQATEVGKLTHNGTEKKGSHKVQEKPQKPNVHVATKNKEHQQKKARSISGNSGSSIKCWLVLSVFILSVAISGVFFQDQIQEFAENTYVVYIQPQVHILQEFINSGLGNEPPDSVADDKEMKLDSLHVDSGHTKRDLGSSEGNEDENNASNKLKAEQQAREDASNKLKAEQQAKEDASNKLKAEQQAKEDASNKLKAEQQAKEDASNKLKAEQQAKEDASNKLKAEQQAKEDASNKLKAEQQAKEDASNKLKAEQQAKEDASNKLKAEQQAREDASNKLKAEQQAREDASNKLKAEQQAREDASNKLKAEQQAREDASNKLKAEQQAREDASNKLKAEQQAKEDASNKLKAEQQAKEDASNKLKAEQQAKEDASNKLKAEQQAKEDASNKLKAEQQVKEDASNKLKAEQQAKEDASNKLKAEQQAKEDASNKLKAEQQAKEDASNKLKAEQQAKEDASNKLKAEQQAKEDASNKLKAEQQAREDASNKLKAEQQAREDASNKLKAEQQAKEDASNKLKAEQQAREDASNKLKAEQQAREDASNKLKAEQQAREDASNKLKAEQQAKEDASNKLKAEQQAKEDASNKLKAEQQAKEDASNKLKAEQQAKEDASNKLKAEQQVKEDASNKLKAEQQAKEDASNKLKAEQQAKEDASNKLKAEQQAKEDASNKLKAEQQAKEDASNKLKAEQQAKEDASNKLKAEQQAREDASNKLKAEQQAREDASNKLKAEQQAREDASNKLKAEQQAKEDASNKLKAEQQAKEDASNKLKAEQQAREDASNKLKAEQQAREDASNKLKADLESHGSSVADKERTEWDSAIVENANKQQEIESKLGHAASDDLIKLESEASLTPPTEPGLTSYVRASITSEGDFEIYKDLDEADGLLESENLEAAIEKYDNILLQNPLSPRAHYGKGLTLDKLGFKYMSNENLEQAIDFLALVLQLVNVPEELQKLAGRKLAERQQFRGWGGQAVKTLKTLIQRFPEDMTLKNELGVSYLMIGHNDRARDVFKEVLVQDSTNGFAKAHLGFILKTQDNDLEQAIELLTDGIKSGAPGTVDGRFYLHLGDSLLRLGRESEARALFQEGADKGLFLSAWQRSLYNVDRLTGRPWWTQEQTPYQEHLKMLQDNWKVIRDEGLAQLNAKTGSFMPEEENLRDTGDWKQFTLYQQGRKKTENCEKAPETCRLIDLIPDAKGCKRGQVKFSVMSPGIHVWPHVGPTNCRIRAHLGLVVPEGPVIRVMKETRTWKEGEFIIFDDSFEHEVWHEGSELRLILIIDFWHPDLTEVEKRRLSAI